MMIKSEKYDVGNAYCRALRIWQALMIPAAMSFPTCDMEVGSFMGLIWTKIIFFSKAKIKEANPFSLIVLTRLSSSLEMKHYFTRCYYYGTHYRPSTNDIHDAYTFASTSLKMVFNLL